MSGSRHSCLCLSVSTIPLIVGTNFNCVEEMKTNELIDWKVETFDKNTVDILERGLVRLISRVVDGGSPVLTKVRWSW